MLQGGYGAAINGYIHEHYPEVKVLNIALPDTYVEHGNVTLLRKGLGIDSDSVIWRLKKQYLDLERQNREWKNLENKTREEESK